MKTVYLLTKDVENPKSDRRSRTVETVKMWPKDSLWLQTIYGEGTAQWQCRGLAGYLVEEPPFPTGKQMPPLRSTVQVAELKPHLVVYPFSGASTQQEFDALELLYGFDAKYLLRWLFLVGRIKADDLRDWAAALEKSAIDARSDASI